MSNYISITVKRSKLTKVQDWINEYSKNPNDIVVTKLNDDLFLFFIAKNVLEDFYASDNLFFKGYAIDHKSKQIIFGAQGKKEHLKKPDLLNKNIYNLEGCYLSCSWEENKIIFSNDAFAICSMFYFSEKDIVAVSDSFYVLSKLRKYLGLANTPNEEVLLARAWGNTMSGQLLSDETQIEQIKYAPLTTIIKIEDKNNLLITKSELSESNKILHTSIDEYENEIRNSMKRITSVIHSLSQLSVNSIRVALSGGFDSRIVLAAALNSPAARELAIFNCTNNSAQTNVDYAVVKELSETFNFPLGLREPNILRTVKDKTINPVKLWAISNAGSYDFLYTANYSAKKAPIFQLGGFGAEAYKGMYGWRNISRIGTHIKDQNVADAFVSQCEKGIEQIGIKKDHPTGSEWHYLGYRNALHGGRSTMTSMFGLRPLMQHRLVGLSRSPSNPLPAQINSKTNMLSDMLIYSNPNLAKFRFDKPEKNLDHNYVDSRSKFLGEMSSSDIETYEILGQVNFVNHGAPDLFYEVANNINVESFSAKFILEQMNIGYEALPAKCRNSYKDGYEEMKSILSKDNTNLSSLRSYAGKLTALGLIFQ